MPSYFELDPYSYGKAQDMVRSVDTALLDARPAWRRLVIRWQDRAKRQFANAQRRQVHRDTRYQRRKAERGGTPLVVTGRFKADLTTPETQDLKPLEATIGVDLDHRGAFGRFVGDGAYIAAVNGRFKVWKPLTLKERIDWSTEIVHELEDQVATAMARANG